MGENRGKVILVSVLFAATFVLLSWQFGLFGGPDTAPMAKTQSEIVRACASAYFQNHLGEGIGNSAYMDIEATITEKGDKTFEVAGTLSWTFARTASSTTNGSGPGKVTIKVEGQQFSASEATAPREYLALNGPLQPATLPVPK